MSDDLPSNKVPTNRLPASALPYGIDTIVIPFTWSDPPKRQPPRMWFGNYRWGTEYGQSPTRGMDYLETAEYNRMRASEVQQTSAKGENLPISTADMAANNTEVPALDDLGEPIIGAEGLPISRPTALSPQMFVREGLKDQYGADTTIIDPSESFGERMAQTYRDLEHFARFGIWDAQRLTGKFDDRYIDYATVAIGLYAAAAGIPRAVALEIQNYVARNSHYPPGTKYDDFYRNLPIRNVRNTDIGYELFRSRRVQSDVQIP